MGKYSSDSESEKRGAKSSYKNRSRRRSSSSSDSSDSRSGSSRRRRDRKSDRHRSRTRSKSRDRYKSRRSRSNSISNYKSKPKSYKSDSKERSRYRRSPSRDHRRRSRSKDHHRSRRSRSKSYIREYASKPRRHSSSRSNSSESNSDKSNRKGVAATKSLKNSTPNNNGMEGKSSYDKSPDCVIIENKVLDEINEDSFTQKPFSSKKSKNIPENIVIDLKKQTIKVPEVEPVEPDSIFHHNLFLNEEARMEKWVKELYSYRQKSLQQGLKNF